MTSIQYAADCWKTNGRRQFCRKTRSLASVYAAKMRRPNSASSDIRLRNESGIELGVVVAPRREVVLGANGPTIYLRKSPGAARQDRGQAA